MDNFMITAALCAAASFVLAAVIGPVAIPVLTRLKFGQEIREIGPKWHKKKSGTPTMGGVIFILAITISCLLFSRTPKMWCLLGGAWAFGLIGFVDDFIKVVMKRNLGLTSLQKLLLQIAAAAAVLLLGLKLSFVDTSIVIPFMKSTLDIGVWLLPLAIFVLVGGTNSVNLTDGLDGLAASVTAVVGVFFTVSAYRYGRMDEALFAAALTGGCMAFLLYNAYPAKVFMGDTGSLFLGGALCSLALFLKMPVVLVIAGGVYVIETLSVIIQVTSFKLTGKRVFKMSPIHHHFEMLGWSEQKIVLTAIFACVVFCAIAFFSLGASI